MAKKINKFPKFFSDKRLTAQGAEILDTTPIAVPIGGEYSAISDTQVILERMLQREMAKRGLGEQDDDPLDDYDFEVDDDRPVNRFTDSATKKEILNTYVKVKKSQRNSKSKPPENGGAEVPEGPSGNPAGPVDQHSSQSSNPLAGSQSPTESASGKKTK